MDFQELAPKEEAIPEKSSEVSSLIPQFILMLCKTYVRILL